jgi:hypothetical protein
MKKRELVEAGMGGSLSELLMDMFIAMLLLSGVTQGNVAKVVHVSKVRVNSIGKNLKVKNSRGERES